ncbi:MAG: ABC transporter permease [Elusimicrobiales bacterium]|nr:ABC transporter permease [Elusimicrobiales bacterium]
MLAILWRDLKTQYTKVFWLIANFCPPLFYLFFFALIFSSSMKPMMPGGPQTSYLTFFLPGLIIMQSFSVFQTTFSLVHLDKRLKILETIRTTRTTVVEYFFAKSIGAQVLAFARALLVYLIGVVFFHITLSASSFLALSLTLLLSNAIWFNLGFVLGFMIETEEKRDIFQQLFTLPVTFLSTIYYSASNVPGGLAAFVRLNPLTAASNLSRGALLDPGFSGRADAYFLSVYLALSLCGAWAFFRFTRKESFS